MANVISWISSLAAMASPLSTTAPSAPSAAATASVQTVVQPQREVKARTATLLLATDKTCSTGSARNPHSAVGKSGRTTTPTPASFPYGSSDCSSVKLNVGHVAHSATTTHCLAAVTPDLAARKAPTQPVSTSSDSQSVATSLIDAPALTSPDEEDDMSCTPRFAAPQSPIYGPVGNEDFDSDWLVLDNQWSDACSSVSDTADYDDGASSIVTLESIHVPPQSDTSSVHNCNYNADRQSSLHPIHPSRPQLSALLAGGSHHTSIGNRSDLRSPTLPMSAHSHPYPQLLIPSSSGSLSSHPTQESSTEPSRSGRVSRQLARRTKRLAAASTTATIALTSGGGSSGPSSMHPALAELRDNELKAAKSRRMTRREIQR
ncbi:hypothetical protein BASA50_008085 [Batrachochytrium salamandrivorans]|uniref:BZIP domain-containing protein n=1 Tax=Batrachochytrium salamandrivorans TaxID=1357716 RepID=A0ABQ8F8G1_9FUNG|nr:hypothetical protein BASA62_010414 [Batrachochytrium salamandrivorans]KAH6579495.1 hypothetical protein BASA61_010247 [Batrachochytrium salamandrivorans]KAH6583262.1 hypothetical protein BASA60_001534 [Batrachochytrium salamandrivorans]KAH6592469.1 hypothetical protein BASA50_008085 [Batrachochytrium salamandrivorans]KAH9274400.1 hypothetical protein BASA83_003030 [Batrachochytrium salamandrivorans]